MPVRRGSIIFPQFSIASSSGANVFSKDIEFLSPGSAKTMKQPFATKLRGGILFPTERFQRSKA